MEITVNPDTQAFNPHPKFRAQLSRAMAFAASEAARIAAMPLTPNLARPELTFHDQHLADAFGGIGPEDGIPAAVERSPFTPPPFGSPALALVA